MMLAELVVDHRVGQGVLADDALTVDVWDVVSLGERFQRTLPRNV